jgi:hypothetical protein
MPVLTSFSMTPGAIAALTSAALRTLGRFETGALKASGDCHQQLRAC